MRKEDLQTAAGMSLPAMVFIVFLILKLSGVITWSWWWITSPLWIVVGLVLLLSLQQGNNSEIPCFISKSSRKLRKTQTASCAVRTEDVAIENL